jgi:CBS domain-containing protein
MSHRHLEDSHRKGAEGREARWRREAEIQERRRGEWRSDPAWREMMERRSAASHGFAPTYGRTGWEYGAAYGEDYTRDREGKSEHWGERDAFTPSDIMTRDVKAASRDSSLQMVAKIMKEENCGIVPVVGENQRLLGVVTDRDVVIRTLAEGKAPFEVKVEDIMTEDIEAVIPDEEIHSVIDLMGKKQVRRVPVVDPDDRLAGIISMADIVNRANYDEDLQEALAKISDPRSFWSQVWR